MGKIIGGVLLVGGILVAVVIGAVLIVMLNEEQLTASGAILGFALGFIILVLPQLGVGIFLMWKGGQQEVDDMQAKQQRKLLNIVQAQGQISITDLVIEMGSTKDDVQRMLRNLVGMGLFSGYVNWQEGMLYSRQANELRELSHCANCNGQLELAGKGVINCPYCGTEYFLD